MKEFKILELKNEKTYENTEKALADRSAEGWELVCLSKDWFSGINGKIIIVLQKDK